MRLSAVMLDKLLMQHKMRLLKPFCEAIVARLFPLLKLWLVVDVSFRNRVIVKKPSLQRSSCVNRQLLALLRVLEHRLRRHLAFGTIFLKSMKLNKNQPQVESLQKSQHLVCKLLKAKLFQQRQILSVGKIVQRHGPRLKAYHSIRH